MQNSTVKPAPFEILPGLDLSAFPKKIDPKYTHVLNMCTTSNPIESYDAACKLLNIPILDWDNIKPHIQHICDFIDSALRVTGNRVLVHCALGLNRSASAITAYLCHRNQTDSRTALKYLKSRKPDVSPCVIFLEQIDQYFGREQKKDNPMARFHERHD